MAIWMLKALKTSKVVMHQQSAHTAQGKNGLERGTGQAKREVYLTQLVKVSGRCLDRKGPT